MQLVVQSVLTAAQLIDLHLESAFSLLCDLNSHGLAKDEELQRLQQQISTSVAQVLSKLTGADAAAIDAAKALEPRSNEGGAQRFTCIHGKGENSEASPLQTQHDTKTFSNAPAAQHNASHKYHGSSRPSTDITDAVSAFPVTGSSQLSELDTLHRHQRKSTRFSHCWSPAKCAPEADYGRQTGDEWQYDGGPHTVWQRQQTAYAMYLSRTQRAAAAAAAAVAAEAAAAARRRPGAQCSALGGAAAPFSVRGKPLPDKQRCARYAALDDVQRGYLAEQLHVLERLLRRSAAAAARNAVADAWWRWQASMRCSSAHLNNSISPQLHYIVRGLFCHYLPAHSPCCLCCSALPHRSARQAHCAPPSTATPRVSAAQRLTQQRTTIADLTRRLHAYQRHIALLAAHHVPPRGAPETSPCVTAEGLCEALPPGAAKALPRGTSDTTPPGATEASPRGTSEALPCGASEVTPPGVIEASKQGPVEHRCCGAPAAGDVQHGALTRGALTAVPSDACSAPTGEHCCAAPICSGSCDGSGSVQRRWAAAAAVAVVTAKERRCNLLLCRRAFADWVAYSRRRRALSRALSPLRLSATAMASATAQTHALAKTRLGGRRLAARLMLRQLMAKRRQVSVGKYKQVGDCGAVSNGKVQGIYCMQRSANSPQLAAQP
ncbi:hypothetical protein JKP88DRAFT_244302 [Tribonema minus]|uniref:Uncharacterized protein n=1 Tax=Tribonema minus TaxID=303371 RepID=A0A836CGH0_9STRA|nr:hypothetical protein JKP88DRAFT_244302 [Tribonema minus]